MSDEKQQKQMEWWRAERITLMGFTTVLGCVLALSVLGYSGMDNLQRNTQQIAERYNHKNLLIQSMTTVINHRMMMIRDILLVDDPFIRDEMVEEYSRLALDYDRDFSKLNDMEGGLEEKHLLEQMAKLVAGNTDLREAVRGLPTDTSQLDVKQILNRSMALNAGIYALLNELQAHQRKGFESELAYVKEIHSRNLTILAFSFILMFVIMLFIAYRVSGYVKQSNRQLTGMAMEKSMLLATMSHEIRTPLTSIIGFGETLLDTDTTKEERIAGINAIVRNGRYLQGVINDVLDFSKLDAGRMECQTESVSMAACLDDLDGMLRGRAQSKGLAFTIMARSPLPEQIQTDFIKCRQILINLLGNAIKFTEKGEVRLEVDYDEQSNRMQFDVIDTGAGIDSESIQRLFMPYRQVGQNHQEGTGLGLYISREMAGLLGGDLSVSSVPGEGSQFTLTLPVGDVSHEARIEWRRQTEMGSSRDASQRRMQFSGHILLAEDRKDNQKLFSIYLSKAGVEVDIVENGEQAIEAMQSRDYALVLMDMQMPGMDGISATRELRRLGFRLPIIALTANESARDRENCQQAGFDDFLTKPINRADFLEVLARYLQPRVPDESETEEPIYSQIFEQEPDLRPAVDYFVGQLPDIQTRIHELLERGDWATLKTVVHDMKGTAGGVGYPMLSQLAMQVEFAMAKEDYEEVEYLVGLLGSRIHRICLGYTEQRQAQSSSSGH